MSEWISVKDRPPPIDEPIVYISPRKREGAKYGVGIAYRTVSKKWKPEAESTMNPHGFTHWMPLPDPPN